MLQLKPKGKKVYTTILTAGAVEALKHSLIQFFDNADIGEVSVQIQNFDDGLDYTAIILWTSPDQVLWQDKCTI